MIAQFIRRVIGGTVRVVLIVTVGGIVLYVQYGMGALVTLIVMCVLCIMAIVGSGTNDG
jgi:hypothetical protein